MFVAQISSLDTVITIQSISVFEELVIEPNNGVYIEVSQYLHCQKTKTKA